MKSGMGVEESIHVEDASILEPRPLLETSIIRRDISGRYFWGSQITEVLRMTPNLIECKFVELMRVHHQPVRSLKRCRDGDGDSMS
jgi:hypothetical protein